jgi:hypothetical protein
MVANRATGAMSHAGPPPRGAVFAERDWRRHEMLDVLFIVITIAFFALAWAYVRGCDRV